MKYVAPSPQAVDGAMCALHLGAMTLADDVKRGYADAAKELIAQYDAVASATIYAPVIAHLPLPPAKVLDVGTGNGRDAAWLIGLGYDVIAVDPVAAFVQEARSRAPGAHVAQDQLPELALVEAHFDLVLVNAVWQHIDPIDRSAAFARLASVLKPEGRLILSLRLGPGHVARPVAPIDPDQTFEQARRAGLKVIAQQETESLQAGNIAAGVTWIWLVLAPANARVSTDGVPVR